MAAGIGGVSFLQGYSPWKATHALVDGWFDQIILYEWMKISNNTNTCMKLSKTRKKQKNEGWLKENQLVIQSSIF